MTDQLHLRQSSPLTAIPKVANRPHRTADRTYTADRRIFLVFLVSGVAISAWALFPSTVERGIYVPPPEMAPPSAADVNSAGKGLTGNPLELARADFRLMEAKLDTSTPTMYGSATVWYPSPAANVSVVSVRSKLQALLMLLHSQSGDVDPAALEAKLQALLTLPDSVLAQLIEHPDLADLNKMLDAVFLGESDLSGVKTELDKIEVTSVPAPTENIDVVTVNGKPAYIVHSPVVQMATENVAGSPVSALPPPPAGPVTVVSLVQAPASLSATAFAMPPTSAQLPPPPAPAAQIAALTLAPTSEQLSRPPAPASVSAPASVQESAQNSQTGSSGTSQTGSTGTSSGAASQGASGDGSTKSDDRSTGSGNPPPDSGQGSQGQGSQGSNHGSQGQGSQGQGSQGSNHGSQGSGHGSQGSGHESQGSGHSGGED